MRAFGWFLGLMVLAILGMGLLSYPAWLLLHPHFDFPFHRIGERVGMLVLLTGLVLLSRRLGVADRASLGYGLSRQAFLREMLLGLALGVATMLALVGLMSVLGLIGWRSGVQLTAAAVAKLAVLRLLSGLAVALIEETFLRGAMFSAIARESGTRPAVILTALVYSATHFFASFHIAAAQVGPHSGLDLLAGTLRTFAHPLVILDAFVALFAVGVALALVRCATGNIAACLGLHAGWVWVMLVAHELTQPARGAALGWLLSRFDGFVGWLVFGWTLLLTWPLWRYYRRGFRPVNQAARR